VILPAARVAVVAAVTLLLLSLLLDLPTVPYDNTHDLASHAAFAYFTKHGFQFGVDVIENAGPLAFVHLNGTYSGDLTLAGVGIKAALRLGLALLIAGSLAAPIGWAARLIWIGAVIAPSVLAGPDHQRAMDTSDGLSILTVYLGAAFLLGNIRPRLTGLLVEVMLALLLSLIALTKHTMLLLIVATLVVVSITRLLRGDVRGGIRIWAALLSWGALVWTLAGQEFANLPAFLHGAFSFSSGYNETMGIDAPMSVTLLAAALVVSSGLFAIRSVRAKRCSPSLAIVAGMALVILWKHGLVRADPPHVAMLFAGVSQLLPAIVWASDRPPNPSAAEGKRSARASIALITVGALLVASFVGASWCVERMRLDARPLLDGWRSQARWLYQPAARIAALEARLEENRKRYALPAIRSRVGTASIDQYGFRQGYLLLNRLHYVPRPIPITFVASNGELCRRNEAFYRGAQAPAFVLANLDPLDNHLVSQRDGLALAALFDNYHLVEVEQGQLLLRRNAEENRSRAAEWSLLAEHEVRVGERVPLGADASAFIYASVAMKPRWTARLRSLFLRPPLAQIRLRFQDGKGIIRRINLAAPDVPFLVRPLVEDNADLLAAYRGTEALRKPDGLVIEPAPGMEAYFDPTVRVRLYRGPAPNSQLPARKDP